MEDLKFIEQAEKKAKELSKENSVEIVPVIIRNPKTEALTAFFMKPIPFGVKMMVTDRIFKQEMSFAGQDLYNNCVLQDVSIPEGAHSNDDAKLSLFVALVGKIQIQAPINIDEIKKKGIITT